MQPWIDWKKVREYSKMPPTQRLTVLYSVIILTLAGMNFRQWMDGKGCQRAQIIAEQEKAAIRRECDSTKFALAQFYEKQRQELLLDRIKKSDEREHWMDSTLAVMKETMKTNKRTLNGYAH